MPHPLEQAPSFWGAVGPKNYNHKRWRMALSEVFLSDDIHPIDIVETLAEHHDWDFDRIAEDQIAMAVVGQWRSRSFTKGSTR